MNKPRSRSRKPQSRSSGTALRSRRGKQAEAASTSTPEAAKGREDQRISLLIDADNVSHQHLATLRKFIGDTPLISARAYGDFQGRLSGWRAAAAEWPELELVDQRSYTPGKNAADMRMTIDAVKLLAGENPPTTLVFVTNDSDFTPVVEDAKRLGVRIVVMGERTHRALRSTAHHYLNLSELRDRHETETAIKSDPRRALELLGKAIRLLTPKTKTEALTLIDAFEKMLPELNFGAPAKAPKPPKRAREARPPRPVREKRPEEPNAGNASANAAEIERRRQLLLACEGLVEALVSTAQASATADGWIKVEFLKKDFLRLHPGLEVGAPRYAKFYRMLEDTGRFETEMRGSTVYARVKS
ncbi:MAG: NYN domain-containing protein [Verrucomicrobia bacterium]|nr:NYN domain-containing protein [Verrucomicrobiota bacterium]